MPKGTILSSVLVDVIFIDVSKVTNFILLMSGVAYCENEKQLQDCIN